MTDEFFVAETEFNLSWDEVKLLSRNSLKYAFVSAEVKQDLLDTFDSNMAQFERQMTRTGIAKLGPMPETRAFICKRYELCN